MRNCKVPLLCLHHHTYINNKTCKITEECERTPASCVTYVSDLDYAIFLRSPQNTRSFPPPSLFPSMLL